MATTMHTSAAAPNTKKAKGRATQPYLLWDLLVPGQPCAADNEFQKYKMRLENGTWTKQKSRIGRISITNTKKETILDIFAIYPNEDGVQKCWQHETYGVAKTDLRFENGGKHGGTVERWAKELFADRTVVLHGGQQDLEAFYYEKDAYAKSNVVDTQRLYSDQQNDGTPGLLLLANNILNMPDFRKSGNHSSLDDAHATMDLYLLKQKASLPTGQSKEMQDELQGPAIHGEQDAEAKTTKGNVKTWASVAASTRNTSW